MVSANTPNVIFQLSLFLFILCPSTNSQSLSPPSSSLAYSLLSAGSEQDPSSTSGCSSEQSARVQTQKELMRAVKELKIRLPAEKKTKGRSSTINALKYALSCVKQVQGERPLFVYSVFPFSLKGNFGIWSFNRGVCSADSVELQFALQAAEGLKHENCPF